MVQIIVPSIPLIPPAVDVNAGSDFHFTMASAILDMEIDAPCEKRLFETTTRKQGFELSILCIHQALKERHLFYMGQFHYFPPPSSRPWPLTIRIPSRVVAVIRSRSATAMSFFMFSSTVFPQTTST